VGTSVSPWPLVDATEISRRHDTVEALVGDPEVRDTLRGAHLRALPDIERITRKLERRRASLMDLCRLYQAGAHTRPLLTST